MDEEEGSTRGRLVKNPIFNGSEKHSTHEEISQQIKEAKSLRTGEQAVRLK